MRHHIVRSLLLDRPAPLRATMKYVVVLLLASLVMFGFAQSNASDYDPFTDPWLLDENGRTPPAEWNVEALVGTDLADRGAIELGTTVDERLTAAEPYLAWDLIATPGTVVQAEVADPTGFGLDTYLYVVDGDTGLVLFENDDFGGLDRSVVIFDVAPGVRYRIVASSFAGTGTGAISVTVSEHNAAAVAASAAAAAVAEAVAAVAVARAGNEVRIIEVPGAPLEIVTYGARYVSGGTYTTEGIEHTVTVRNVSPQAIVAIGIGFNAFDVFKRYMGRPLNGIDIAPIAVDATTSRKTWTQTPAASFTFQEYGTGVAYVRFVRLADGTIWEADLDYVLDQLQEIEDSLTLEDLDEE